jgi:cytochrome c2
VKTTENGQKVPEKCIKGHETAKNKQGGPLLKG